jgi:hypothetical protein
MADDDDNATTTFICKICESIFQYEFSILKISTFKKNSYWKDIFNRVFETWRKRLSRQKLNCKRDRRVLGQARN